MDKKLVVNSALYQDKLIEALDGYNDNGITLKFIEKKGLKLYFEQTGLDTGYEGQSVMKKIIRSNDWAKTLYFSITFE